MFNGSMYMEARMRVPPVRVHYLLLLVSWLILQSAQAQTFREVIGQPLAEIEAKAGEGNAVYQYSLGQLYADGFKVPVDESQAVFWYKKAAEQGYWKAQIALGGMYFQGEGVPQDNDLGLSLFLKAAEQGFASAQFFLGFRYVEGNGVPEDYAKGVAWLTKAAEGWHSGAQYLLSQMYESGRGVPQNNVRAYMWLGLASEGGLKVATQELSALGAKMTSEQQAEARQLMAEWLKAHPKTEPELMP
jgi:TPR repeat protein